MFGGTNIAPHEGANQRNLLNDIIVFNQKEMVVVS